MDTSEIKKHLQAFFLYPSSFWVALQGVALVFCLSYLLWFTFFISIAVLISVAGLRAINMYQNTPNTFANPKNIFITGASGGIGKFLALKYAKEGAECIYITGRNEASLAEVSAACLAVTSASKSAMLKVVSIAVDVADRDAMRAEMEKADDATPLDIVIANAGVSASTLPKDMPREEMTRKVFDINVTGVLNSVYPVYDRFVNRKHGQYVFIASIAGIAQLPGNHPYASTKSAVISFGQGLRRELAEHNVGVTVVCPGFVRSGMTIERHESYGLPFFMETDTACDIIYNAAVDNVDVITFPFPMHLGGLIMRVLPFYLHDKISSTVAWVMYRPPTSTKQD